MPGPQTSSTLQYALIALVVFAIVVPLAWPIVQAIAEVFQILGNAINGNFVPLK
jgi:hypothetical protein